jgi:hypothetical protein
VEIERRRRPAGQHRAYPGQARDDAQQGLRHPGDHPRATGGQQGQIAHEMQRVAKPVLMRGEDGHAVEIGEPVEIGQQRGQRQRPAVGQTQALVVIRPGLAPAPRVQQRDDAVDPGARVGGIERDGTIMRGDRGVVLPQDLAHHTEVGPNRRQIGGEGGGRLETLAGGDEIPGLGQGQALVVFDASVGGWAKPGRGDGVHARALVVWRESGPVWLRFG